MNQFHKKHKQPKLTRNEINSLNSPIPFKETESEVKNLIKKTQGPAGFTGEINYSTHSFKILRRKE